MKGEGEKGRIGGVFLTWDVKGDKEPGGSRVREWGESRPSPQGKRREKKRGGRAEGDTGGRKDHDLIHDLVLTPDHNTT